MSEIFQASEKYFEYVEYLCTIHPKSASLNLQSPEFFKETITGFIKALCEPPSNPTVHLPFWRRSVLALVAPMCVFILLHMYTGTNITLHSFRFYVHGKIL